MLPWAEKIEVENPSGGKSGTLLDDDYFAKYDDYFEKYDDYFAAGDDFPDFGGVAGLGYSSVFTEPRRGTRKDAPAPPWAAVRGTSPPSGPPPRPRPVG